MKADTQVGFLVTSFFGGYCLASYEKPGFLSELMTDFLPAFATLVAAYLGARYAFLLRDKKEKEKKDEEICASGNLASFQLLRMLNRLQTYKKTAIDPHISDLDSAHFLISPSNALADDTFGLDLPTLGFLVELDKPNLLGQISVCEQKFRASSTAIVKRSEIHERELQPRIEELFQTSERPPSVEELEQLLGERITQKMKSITKQVIDLVDDAISEITRCQVDLSDVLSDKYPDRKVIRLNEETR